jgi:serine/threonine protein phosphatase 1
VTGRLLTIGDIHGCDTALDTLLYELQINSDDSIVLLGDVVDRGPGTRQVIERLLELQEACHLHFVMGNHEQMMLRALDHSADMSRWLMYGGQEVLDSYEITSLSVGPRAIPEAHIEFLRSAQDLFETPTNVFVHANLEPGIALGEQHEEWLRWARFTGREEPLESGQRVICGHTAQKSGLPYAMRGWVCIDTYAYGDGWLTCLDVETDEFYQANELGEFRTGDM